jgi:hypothetical protein
MAAMIRPIGAILLLSALAGCHSSIQPLRPVERVEMWVPDDAPTDSAAATMAAAAEPATLPASSQPAPPAVAATGPATRPGHMAVKVNDPNQTARFIYKASYDNIWQQSMLLLHHMGFELDRQDYRLGVMTTKSLPSAQIAEFWKPQHVDINDSLENTLNDQRRTVRLTISTVPGKPDFYEIGIQVLVERETNPSENIGGPVFVEGSGFGRNSITLRSDYSAPRPEPEAWVVLGHDPNLERKLINELFKRI